MASVLAEGVVGKVCEMVIQQVADKVIILCNFTEDFERLKNRTEEINCVIDEADEGSSSQKESVKKWLQRVRDIAWEAEDILQECAVDSLYAANIQSCTLRCHQLIYRHQMGRRIQKVKARMSSVVEEGNQLNIVRAAVHHKEEAESSSRSQGQQFKRSSLLPSDSKPVGIQSKIQNTVSLLENPQFAIIAVVGMGGIGKTYLLQHLYDAQKERYEISVWLLVSQFYSISKLQRDLASRLGDLSAQIKEGGVSEQQAAELIHEILLGKKYLIVLDDVWRAAREDDFIAKIGIPNSGNMESKILISTRSREVCRNLNAHFYEMENLSGAESWRLFCSYAFPGSEGNMVPQHLEEVARNIMKECGNLPLAIKTTASSLRSTRLPRDWHSKLIKLKRVGTSKDPVMDILKLSYDSLPAHLKAYFAYLSFFPEDEQIECEYLTYLWMGEGLIPVGENPWDCLDHLSNLCLIEVCEKEWLLDKYCKIHDLLLDLAILISRENKCAFSIEDAFSKLPSMNTGGGSRCCRLFLAKKDIDKDAISERRPVSPTLVRTLSLSRNTEIGRNIPTILFSNMRVLRVLDLSYTNISTLPACVGEMKLLKVLNLRWTQINKLPECVRCLKSLSFLNVSHCRGLAKSEAPKWISELRCLQHLEGPFERMPNGISKLEYLRTLRLPKRPAISYMCSLSLSTVEDDLLRIEDVGKMSELQEIGFNISDESQLKKMEEWILAPLLNMRRLEVNNTIDGMQSDLPQFPERMSAMKDLEHLTLHDFAVPSWICCLANLRYLYLDCDCSNYPELQAMPNLVTLCLWNNKRCRKLPRAFGKSQGFPQLRFFEVRYFPELEEFPEMEDGAMASLEKLVIHCCSKVNKVGEGLERLKALQEFNLYSSGTDELREIWKAGGIYRKKIKAVNPHITIRC